jgi:hypothetical protein
MSMTGPPPIRIGSNQSALLVLLHRAGGAWSPDRPFSDLGLREAQVVNLFNQLEEQGLVEQRLELGAMSLNSYPYLGKKFISGRAITPLGVLVAKAMLS